MNMKEKTVKVFIMCMAILTAGSPPLEIMGEMLTGEMVQEEIRGTMDAEPEGEIPGLYGEELSESEMEIPGIMDENDTAFILGQAETSESEDRVGDKLLLTMTYLKNNIQNPIVGTVGGEWSVLAMARYGNLSESAKKNYLSNLYQTLEQNQGVLNDAKYTEYSRVILALTSIGIRPDSVNGYNLLAMLSDYESVTYQGINGPIFALIALDSHSYEIPLLSEEETAAGKVQTSRENLISKILDAQLRDGGWALSGNTSDPDMTSMAIQALEPYAGNDGAVSQAVEDGIAFLAGAQSENGGFASEDGENLESAAQVLIALSSVNVSLLEDSRFIKNGNSVVDAVMSYQNTDGSFSHTPQGEADAMATDQGALALLAYIRAKDGLTSLYDMTDVQISVSEEEEDPQVVQAFQNRVNELPEQVTLQDKNEVYLLLTEIDLMGRFQEKENIRARLNRMTQEIARQEQQVQELDSAIWNQIDPLSVSLKDKKVIERLIEQYLQIPEANRNYLDNQKDLLKAQTIVEKLEQGILAKEIFENVNISSKDYEYQGDGYSVTLYGKNSYDKKDMKADVESSYKNNDFYFQIKESGDLPGVIQFEISCRFSDGWYQLEHKEGGSYKQQKKIYVKNGKFSFQTDQGGQYRLCAVQDKAATASLTGTQKETTVNEKQSTTKTSNTSVSSGSGNNQTSSRNTSSGSSETTVTSNMVTANVKDNIVSKEQLEKIKGTDKNLVMKGKLEDGKEYSMIINGKDISKAADINIGIKKESENEENIRLLSENPEIFSFQQKGNFPGEVQVQVPVEKEDGEYILFRYNEEEGKAEVVQKIEVKDKSTKFVIEMGGDYFIDTRAKAKSVKELKLEDDDSWETVSVKDADQDVEYFIGEGETEKSDNKKIWFAAAAGILALAVIIGVLYWRSIYLLKKGTGGEKDEK